MDLENMKVKVSSLSSEVADRFPEVIGYPWRCYKSRLVAYHIDGMSVYLGHTSGLENQDKRCITLHHALDQ
jgi:hypothetical protein